MNKLSKATAATVFLGVAFWGETLVDHSLNDNNEDAIVACYQNNDANKAEQCANDVHGSGDVLPGFAEIITLAGATACGVISIRTISRET